VDRTGSLAVFQRDISGLQVLANLISDSGFLFGKEPSGIDATIYGFVANIYFYRIDPPLKKFVSSRPNLVRHCNSLHAAVMGWDIGADRGIISTRAITAIHPPTPCAGQNSS
jgi:hypothetical protein